MTGAELTTFVRYLLNESTAAFWADAEILVYVNRAQQYYQNKIIQADENFFATTDATTDYVSGTQEYDLPTDCIKVIRVERTDLSPVKLLVPIAFNDKHKYENTGFLSSGDEYYYLYGTKIGIVPKPTTSLTNNLKNYYVGRLSDITSGTSSSIPAEFHELLGLYAAILARIKDDASITELTQRQLLLETQMMNSIHDRQIQRPRYVNYKLDEDYYDLLY